MAFCFNLIQVSTELAEPGANEGSVASDSESHLPHSLVREEEREQREGEEEEEEEKSEVAVVVEQQQQEKEDTGDDDSLGVCDERTPLNPWNDPTMICSFSIFLYVLACNRVTTVFVCHIYPNIRLVAAKSRFILLFCTILDLNILLIIYLEYGSSILCQSIIN